jgi:ribosomal protein S27AE
MIEPRSALPSKPDSREVCGRCHAAGSTDPLAAKAMVDLAKHGGTYVCWDCHYAHLPEGRK